MRRGYCQREEEGESRCRVRCEGCKEYYHSLEIRKLGEEFLNELKRKGANVSKVGKTFIRKLR